MIPILYDSNERYFTGGGIGMLLSCIECTVTEERNGIYECDFTISADDPLLEEIYCGRIIGAAHNQSGDVQPFDIVSYEKNINGMISFHAVHVSYRQRYRTVSGRSINSLEAAFELLTSSAVPYDTRYSYATDMKSTGYMSAADGVPHTVREMLGGIEGSILDTYHGEYEWNKFETILHAQRGSQKDVAIRYGVNMLDYTEELDFSETYSSCIPYWTGTDDNDNDIIIVGTMQNSGVTTSSGRVECVPLDVTDKFEDQPTQAQVEAMGLQFLNENQTYLPTHNIDIDFIQLQDSPEYAEYEELMNCDLCDSVRVIFPRYNVDGWFKIVKVTYDVLQERYTEMELGTLPTTLAQALGIK